jgi:hypothetical protein
LTEEGLLTDVAFLTLFTGVDEAGLDTVFTPLLF